MGNLPATSEDFSQSHQAEAGILNMNEYILSVPRKIHTVPLFLYLQDGM